jgi:uncharacterized protein YidB (DUF937 family)
MAGADQRAALKKVASETGMSKNEVLSRLADSEVSHTQLQ